MDAGGASINEMSVKVRQLEMNLLDMKGALERRLMGLSEELPSQIRREVKAIEVKE